MARALGSPPALEAAKNREQNDRAKRRYDDGWQVEALRVAKTEKAADDQATNEGANNTDYQIGQQAAIAAGDPFGEPTGEDTDDQPGDDTHCCLLHEC